MIAEDNLEYRELQLGVMLSKGEDGKKFIFIATSRFTADEHLDDESPVPVQKKNNEQMRQGGLLCIWGSKGVCLKRGVGYCHKVRRPFERMGNTFVGDQTSDI